MSSGFSKSWGNVIILCNVHSCKTGHHCKCSCYVLSRILCLIVNCILCLIVNRILITYLIYCFHWFQDWPKFPLLFATQFAQPLSTVVHKQTDIQAEADNSSLRWYIDCVERRCLYCGKVALLVITHCHIFMSVLCYSLIKFNITVIVVVLCMCVCVLSKGCSWYVVRLKGYLSPTRKINRAERIDKTFFNPGVLHSNIANFVQVTFIKVEWFVCVHCSLKIRRMTCFVTVFESK